jgi:uncharacterized repeat protein (TIGR01451 family)
MAASTTLFRLIAVVVIMTALPVATVAQVTPTPGVVYAWGENARGQLGIGTTVDSSVPVVVPGLSDVVMVSAGWWHSIALRADGTVWTWGSNDSGQLGNGTTTSSSVPIQVPDLSGIVQVSAGDSFNLALKADGTVWAWGHNGSGRLGDGTTTNRPSPVQVEITNVVQIASGVGYSLAIRYGPGNNRTVWAWGYNGNGRLGNGTTDDAHIPDKVANLDNVALVAAGGGHSLAVRGDGTAWAWGYNGDGSLGIGSQTSTTVPLKVAYSGYSVYGVASGDAHSLFVVLPTNPGNLALVSAGSNTFGQLGTGDTTLRTSPVAVTNLGSLFGSPQRFALQPVIAAGTHSLAALDDGTAWAWGDNKNGQLGVGFGGNRLTPVQVPGLTGIVAVSASGEFLLSDVGHSLAIASAVITMSRSSLDFGFVGTGTVSAPQTVTITNQGELAATFEDIRTCGGGSGGPFLISGPTLPFTLASGDSVTVSVRYSPGNIGGNALSCLAAIDSGFHSPQTIYLSAVGDPSADIAIEKTTFPASVVPGETIVYGLTVTNRGPALADSVTITDALPNSLTFVRCTVSGGGVCGGAGNNRTVTFAPLAPGATETVLLEATLNPGVADGTLVSNTASADSVTMGTCTTCDPHLENNSVTWQTVVHNKADLLVSQRVSKLSSRQLTYEISVRNVGPYAAKRISNAGRRPVRHAAPPVRRGSEESRAHDV